MLDFVDSWFAFYDDSQEQLLSKLEKQLDDVEKELENKSGLITYIIAQGDTLTSIARKFGSSPTELANINHIKNPDLIYAGNKMLVPSRFAAINPAEKLSEIIKETSFSITPKKKTIKYVTTYTSKPIWNEETGRYIHLELGKYIEVEDDSCPEINLDTTKN